MTSIPLELPPGYLKAAPLIEAGLRSQVLFSDTPEYAERQQSYWSNCAKRRKPACIVLPRTTLEVATAVRALVVAGHTFAVRSGGHTHWSGSNNIDESGITLDLSLLNTTTFHAESETVDIGPGGRWRDVYEELHQHGRVVAGCDALYYSYTEADKHANASLPLLGVEKETLEWQVSF